MRDRENNNTPGQCSVAPNNSLRTTTTLKKKSLRWNFTSERPSRSGAIRAAVRRALADRRTRDAARLPRRAPVRLLRVSKSPPVPPALPRPPRPRAPLRHSQSDKPGTGLCLRRKGLLPGSVMLFCWVSRQGTRESMLEQFSLAQRHRKQQPWRSTHNNIRTKPHREKFGRRTKKSLERLSLESRPILGGSPGLWSIGHRSTAKIRLEYARVPEHARFSEPRVFLK